MNYKIEGAIKRNRKNFIIFAILWIFIAIAFASPVGYTIHMANANGSFDFEIFLETFGPAITNPFSTFGNVFSS